VASTTNGRWWSAIPEKGHGD